MTCSLMTELLCRVVCVWMARVGFEVFGVFM